MVWKRRSFVLYGASRKGFVEFYKKDLRLGVEPVEEEYDNQRVSEIGNDYVKPGTG